MTNEERDIISQFVARIGGAPAPSGAPAGSVPSGSVPATVSAPLAPVDRDADALIGQLFQRYPEAPYRMTQLAFVQEQGLIQAQNRIAAMEAELHRTQQALQQAQQAQQPQPQQPQSGGGFFSSLFGGGRPQPAPPPNPGPWGGQQGAPPQGYAPPPAYAPPPPQYAPGYQPGMFQRSGSGFLGSALTTAAGVGGGIVVGNLLTNMLTGEHHMGGGAWGEPSGGMAASPWGAPAATDQGTWDNTAGAASNQDYVDNGTWDQQPAQDSSWTDNSGGSWDSGGGDSSSWDSGGGDSGGGDSGGGSDDSF